MNVTLGRGVDGAGWARGVLLLLQASEEIIIDTLLNNLHFIWCTCENNINVNLFITNDRSSATNNHLCSQLFVVRSLLTCKYLILCMSVLCCDLWIYHAFLTKPLWFLVRIYILKTIRFDYESTSDYQISHRFEYCILCTNFWVPCQLMRIHKDSHWTLIRFNLTLSSETSQFVIENSKIYIRFVSNF